MPNTDISSLVALSSVLAQSGKRQELLDCVRNTYETFRDTLSDPYIAEKISAMLSNLRILLFQERDVLSFEKYLKIQLGLYLHHCDNSQIAENNFVFHSLFIRLLHITGAPDDQVTLAASSLIWLYRKRNCEVTPMAAIELSAALVALADVLRKLPRRRGVEAREMRLANEINVIFAILRDDDMMYTIEDSAVFHENAAKALNYLPQFYLQIGFEDAAIAISDNILSFQ
jgi:hypothetical protein